MGKREISQRKGRWEGVNNGSPTLQIPEWMEF